MKLIYLPSIVLLLSVSTAAARDVDGKLRWQDTRPSTLIEQHLTDRDTVLQVDEEPSRPLKVFKSFKSIRLPWLTDHVAKLDKGDVGDVLLDKELDITEGENLSNDQNHSFTLSSNKNNKNSNNSTVTLEGKVIIEVDNSVFVLGQEPDMTSNIHSFLSAGLPLLPFLPTTDQVDKQHQRHLQVTPSKPATSTPMTSKPRTTTSKPTTSTTMTSKPTTSTSMTSKPVTPCSGITAEIKVLTDYYPAETSWSLSNQCGFVRNMTGGPYSSQNTFYNVSECLPAGEYMFTINDRYNDGICCEYGSGSYEILVNGLSTHTGGVFGSSETKTFGVCTSQSPSVSPSVSPSQYCFLDSKEDEFRFRVGELFDAVDKYIGQGCATNPSCEVRQQYGNIGSWCTSKITNMYSLFYNASSFNEPLDGWDLSSVTATRAMFLDASSFNQALNGWNVNKVTDMSFMFYGASQFNQPLNRWNTGNVAAMSNMFDGALQFDQPINEWNVSSVLDMGWMFADSDFINDNTKFHLFNQRLDGWDVSSVINMRFMFAGSKYFNQQINAWNTSQVTDMAGMFSRAPNFDHPLDQWKVDNVNDMSYMFQGATKFNKSLNTWNVKKVASMIAIFNEAANFDQHLNSWNVSKVTSLESMFDKAINFNKPLNAWDVGEVINMTWMFYGASSFNQDLNGWDVSKVSCFQDESGQVTYSGAWIYGMFEGASSFNQELNAWNVSIVTALTGASASSSFAAFKPPKPICWYPGNNKCPQVPQKSTATSCSCRT